jgi:hypothetical protein
MEHYFKIYFITEKFYKLVEKHQEDCLNVIKNNPHLLDFIQKVKQKLHPFKIKLAQILEEEKTLFSREVILNGVKFQKDTLLSRELKQILQLSGTKKGTSLILKEIKPLYLMTFEEKKKHTNKVIYNGKETNSSIFREIEENNREVENLFKQNLCKDEDGRIITAKKGLSPIESDIESENRIKLLFEIEEENIDEEEE